MILLDPKKLLIGLAAAVVVAVSALSATSPAQAAIVPIDLEGGGITWTIVQADQEFFCPTFDLAGDFDDVDNVGALDDVTFTDCTNPWWGDTDVTSTGTWDFAAGSNVSGSVWAADITNITANIVAAGCDFDVAGSVTGEFDSSTQSFVVTSSNVVISNTPSGFLCPVLGVAQGQDIEFDGSWTNTGTTITLP